MGSYFVLSAILWHLFERIFGLHGEYIHLHPLFTNLFFIPTVVLYVLALKEKRRKLGGNITYKQAFFAGFSISMVVALLSPLTTLLIQQVISPNYLENAIDYAVTNKKMTAEMANAMFNLNNYLLQSFIGALIMGIVISAIVSFYIKTKSKKD